MRFSLAVICCLLVNVFSECINQCEKANYNAACVILDCIIDCGTDRLFSATTKIDIRMYNSTITCKAVIAYYEYKVYLQADSISLYNSTIISADITIKAFTSILLDEYSSLSTTAQGDSSEAVKDSLNWGGSYGGRGGGLCYSKTVKAYTYGDFYLPTSRGKGGYKKIGHTQYNSRGGGIIHIAAKEVSLHGSITSDGESCDLDPKTGYSPICNTNHSNGGAGGSILIEADKLVVGQDAYMSASGGYSAYLGGGGGRIAVYSQNDVNVNARAYGAYGRQSDVVCNGGAPGTVYIQSNSARTLRIENENPCYSITPLLLNDTDVELSVTKSIIVPEISSLTAKSITLVKGYLDTSAIQENTYDLTIECSTLQILQYSYIGLSKFNLVDSLTNFKTITLKVNHIYLDPFSVIFQSSKLIITGEDTQVHLAGTIDRRYNNEGSILIYSKTFKLEIEAFITCKSLVIYAHEVEILGTIQVTSNSCKSMSSFKETNQYRCIPNGLAEITDLNSIGNLTEIVNSNSFTVYIQALDSIEIQDGSKIRGSRVGLCSANVDISGLVSASGSGCTPNNGIGAGSADSRKCSGSGGGHGGSGGLGKVLKADLDYCQKHAAGGEAYDQSGLPIYEGSGGGASESGVAGSGGGFIQVEAYSLNVTGVVLSNGAAASKADSEGVGGGAGGSIIVRTRYLEGTGTFNSSGNEGHNGGGNGGGGVIYLDWIGYSDTPEQIIDDCSEYWQGKLQVSTPSKYAKQINYVQSGQTTSSNAQTGQLRANSCAKGYGEIYCKPCGKGYYKEEVGYQSCDICDNKPSDAIYVNDIETDSDCDYECPKSYRSEDDNPDCNSPTYEFLHVYGSPFTILAVFLSFWLVLFILNLVYIKYYFYVIPPEDAEMLNQSNPNPSIKFDSLLYKSPNLKSVNPELESKDMSFHTCRLFLLGNNSYYSPWSLAHAPPVELNAEIYQDEYLLYVKNLNKELVWKWWENVISIVLIIIAPPVQMIWDYLRRKDKYIKLRTLVSECSEDFWIKIELRQMANSIRLSTSKDYTIACLEILDYSKKQVNLLPLKSPAYIMAKGNGSILYPYTISEDDVYLTYFKYSLDFEYKDVFDIFIKEMNSLFRLINLKEAVPNKSEDYFIEISEICNVYNLMLAKNHNIKITPVLFQVPINKAHLNGMRFLMNTFASSSAIYDYRPGLVITNSDSSSAMMRYVNNDYWEINTINISDKETLMNSGVYVADSPSNASHKFWYPISSVLILRPKFNLVVVTLMMTLFISLDTV